MSTISNIQYALVSAAPGPGFDAAVTAQVALGFAPLGVPYVAGGNLEQVFTKGAASSFVQQYAITAVVNGPAGTGSFTVAGDQRTAFNPGYRFIVTGSTGNDGVYTVTSSVFAVSTEIFVKEAVPNATADGNIIAYA